jgi:uncharacterized protein (DUF1015 family)
LLDQVAAGEPTMSMTDEFGTINRLWRVSDPALTSRIQQLMEDKKLLIADGHHRYETALAFHHDHPEIEDSKRVMMTFVNMYSPGLRILATHRVLSGVSNFTPEEFLAAARTEFDVRTLSSEEELRRAWAEPHAGRIRIGVALKGSTELYLLEREVQEREVNVRVLHQLVIQGVLGINEQAVSEERHIRYVRGVSSALEQVRNGGADIALLLEPVPIGQVADISFSGGVMPQKSTDFYPKLLSGLTIYKLEK